MTRQKKHCMEHTISRDYGLLFPIFLMVVGGVICILVLSDLIPATFDKIDVVRVAGESFAFLLLLTVFLFIATMSIFLFYTALIAFREFYRDVYCDDCGVHK